MNIKKINAVMVVLLLGFGHLGLAQQSANIKILSPLPAKVEGIDQPQISLNGVWSFRVENGKPATIKVPGEWEMQGYEVKAGEKAVYEKQISIPESWKGKRIALKFDAVSSNAVVKMNGQYIGEHEGGFVAFEMDVTKAVKSGTNVLTVEVRANTISDILSCVSQYAAHTVGGILRKVTLFALPETHVADLDVEVKFDPKYQDAKLHLQALVANNTSGNQDLAIQYTLKDKSGKTVFEKKTAKKSATGNQTIPFDLDIQVSKPKHWTAESPYLYELTTSLLNGTQVVQSNVQKVGFRDIKIRGNELLVNGRPVKLKGVNRHAVHPLMGRASDPVLDRKDVEVFLAGNLNYIRTSHYPPSEEFLNAADELGLYVESESALNWIQHHASPIWRHWNYQDPKFLPTMLRANMDNVVSNRKHPSIIFWSLGNESRWSDLWAEVNKTVKALDKTRPTVFHDQTWGSFNNAGSKADIANYHYPGINGPKATDTMSRPTLFGEYAHLSDYNRRELLTDPGVRDAFNAPMVTYFDSMYVHKGNLGGAIWSGIDDTFHMPDGRIVGYGPWGPIDGWRREKPEYFGMKKAYSPVRISNLKSNSNNITFDVENRYDFRSLKDVEIKVMVDGKLIPVTSNLQARSAGKLVVPNASGVFNKVEIIVNDDRGFEVEHEIFETPKAVTVNGTAKALALKQDSAFVYITQGDVVYTISKTYGLMTAARTSGEQVLSKGPSVAIIAANAEDGGKPNVAGETYQNNIYPIKHYEQYTLFATQVQARDDKDSIVVDLNLTYQQGTGKQQFIFTKEGLFKTNYEMNYQAGEVSVYQYGLMLELPLHYDELKWSRKGDFSYYPENHIGRNNGVAKLNANNVYEVEAHGEPVAKAWKDDANTMGSNDFRSTKARVITASLTTVDRKQVNLLATGKQASRTWKQDEHIQWLVADYTNSGSEPFYGSPFTDGRITLKKGDVIKGSMILQID